MTTETTNAPAPNSFDAIIARATEAGRATANGVDGIMGLAVAVFDGAYLKLVDKDNVKDVYKAYLVEANGAKFGTRVRLDDKTLKFGVSKLNRFVKFATVTPGSKREKIALVSNAARVIRADVKDKKVVGSMYELIGKVIGKANADKKVSVGDAQIRAWLAPEPKGEEDLVHKALSDLLAKCEALASREEDGFVLNSGRFSQIGEVVKRELEAYKEEHSEQTGEDDHDGSLLEALAEAQEELNKAA